MQANKSRVADLRKSQMLSAWIADYQKALPAIPGRSQPTDCHRCGWPHDKHLMCGMGSSFGQIELGGHTYYIDASNVEFMLDFVEGLGGGFHWRDEIFFEVKDANVVVTHLETYNNCPQVKKWSIPLLEWQSIMKSVETQANLVVAA